MEAKVVLKFLCLRIEVWLCGVEMLGGGSEALKLKDCKQIAKMTKLGPVVHTMMPLGCPFY
jgi:hypothetical protein